MLPEAVTKKYWRISIAIVLSKVWMTPENVFRVADLLVGMV